MDDEKRKFYPMELTCLLRGFNIYIKKTEKHKKNFGNFLAIKLFKKSTFLIGFK
jgi:hypothetical protein